MSKAHIPLWNPGDPLSAKKFNLTVAEVNRLSGVGVQGVSSALSNASGDLTRVDKINHLYVALPLTDDGIPGMTTDDDGDHPGSAECTIYQIIDDLLVPLRDRTAIVYNLSTSALNQDYLLISRTKDGKWVAAISGIGNLTDGWIGACAGCACYPDPVPVTACGSVPVLYAAYQLSAGPLLGNRVLNHTGGCIFDSAVFEVVCDLTSYGNQFWRLTVAEAINTSTLELLPSGGTDLDILYKNIWHFDPLCGNKYGIVERWGIEPEFAHIPPAEVCISPSGTDECPPCADTPATSSDCCPDVLIPQTLYAHFEDAGGCSCIPANTAIVMNWDGGFTWSGQGFIGTCAHDSVVNNELRLTLTCTVSTWNVVLFWNAVTTNLCPEHLLGLTLTPLTVVCDPFSITASTDCCRFAPALPPGAMTVRINGTP